MVPDRGWLQAMASASWTPDLGAVGGRIVSPEAGNWVARYCRFMGYNEFPEKGKPVTWVNSGNAAYQARALREIGGFETLIRLGGEDIEASYRLALAGYRVTCRMEAVTAHYHRETFRALARTCWQRGYARTLRNVLWGSVPRPGAADAVRHTLRWLRCWLGLALLPARALKLLKSGVAPRDCLPFAFLAWVRRTWDRGGQAELSWRLVRREQSLERSSIVPQGSADPSLRPSWARRAPGAAGREPER